MEEGRIPSTITADTASIQNNTKKGGNRISLLGCFFASIRNQNYAPPQNTTKIQTRTYFVVDDKPADELITQRIA